MMSGSKRHIRCFSSTHGAKLARPFRRSVP
jgi:hypothetical protein